MSDTVTRLLTGEKEIILIGTAHVSKKSVDEVKRIIETEKPDRVCIEIDKSRYKALTDRAAWKNLKLSRVLRERKAFLLLSNLVLASFQKRIGLDLGMKPGAEMVAAIEVSKELGIPFSLCDRDIQITLKRAWAKSGFWGKNKLLAVMIGSLFFREKLSKEEIEKLKKKSALESMLEELAGFLPAVKEVLIDERDKYLAAGIFKADGKKIAVVVGAGHVPGIVKRLKKLHTGRASADVSSLNIIPPKSVVSKCLPWLLPAVIVGAIAAGFFLRGTEVTLHYTFKWIVINGSLSAAGALIAMAHPLTIVLAFIAAPITSLIPVIGVGILTGILEGTLKKPRVMDLENLPDDIATLKGFFKNRFTHVLIVFLLSNIGSTIGTFLGGIPLIASLFG